MSLKNKTISGIKWSFASQAGRQISQFIITAILARLLSPADFGLIGMATVFTGFVTVVNEMGVSGALIQKQDVTPVHFSSIFWLNIVMGVLMMGAMTAASGPIAVFYNQPELSPILKLLSINFFIASFSIVQQTIFQKNMEFKKLAIAETLSVLVGGGVGVYCALSGKGAWSLAYQLLGISATQTVCLWLLSKWKPKFILSIDAIKDIFHFSANLAGFNIVNYFARNVDYLLIGKFLGAETLGFYTLAYKLMLVPLQNISSVIGKVMFPAFSTIQSDLVKVREVYLKMIRAISMVTFPMMFGLFAVAPEFIRAIYGSRWQPVIIIVRIFCVCGLIQSIQTTVGNLILAQGKASLQFKLGLLGTFLSASAIMLGLRWGILGVASAYTIEQIFWATYVQRLGNSLVGISARSFLASLSKSLVASLFMIAGIFGLKLIFHSSNIGIFVGAVALGILIYAGLLIRLEGGDLRSARRLFGILEKSV